MLRPVRRRLGCVGVSVRKGRQTMVGALTLYQTSIGKKVMMAVTGFILFGYVFVHMYGNLHVFEGREHLNAYALWLRDMGAPFFSHEVALWIVRIILILAVVGHIW